MSDPSTPIFSCADVHVFIGEKEVVKGVDLNVPRGELHAIMGPNGSGKSTLANAVMGHPAYAFSGKVFLDGEEISGLAPDEKARKGLFLAFQYPVAVPGVTVASFLRAAVSARRNADVPVREFRKELMARMEELEMDTSFAGRYLNDGFSGGEKKRLEVLQLRMLRPRFALLDETDSGLDIDALRIVAAGINAAAADGTGMLLVTHYQRLLNYVKPDVVHVFMDGRIVRSGGPELALELDERGYDWLDPAARAGNGRGEGGR